MSLKKVGGPLLDNVQIQTVLPRILPERPAKVLVPPFKTKDRLGKVVGKTRVDMFGERIILENLDGGHWTDRHNAVQQELAALCPYAGVPAEVEPYGLFSYLLPQQALHRLQQEHQRQVLRQDL